MIERRWASWVQTAWVVPVVMMLGGCDGLLEVKGELVGLSPGSACNVMLEIDGWSVPHSEREVTEQLQANWTVSSYPREYDLVLVCDGYQTVRRTFRTSGAVLVREDLGRIELTPGTAAE